MTYGIRALAAAAVVALPLAAQAADIPVKAPVYKAPPPAAVYNWSGLYIGGHIGGGWSRTNWDNIVDGVSFVVTGASVEQRSTAAIGGGHIGLQQQFGSLLLGIEGSWSWTGFSKSELDIDVPASGTGDRFETRIRDIATVTGRLGFASGNWLAYAKGGYANARVNISVTDTFALVTFDSTKRQSGWTVGGGVEYALAQNWILGVEYDYYRFRSTTHSGLASNGFAFSADVKAQVHAVLARLSYKFGWAGPVVARY